MYVRMVIGEVAGKNQLKQLRSIYRNQVEPQIFKEPGLATTGIMAEENGQTVVFLTMWDNRDNCLRYYCSDAYRQFVSKTEHLLKKDFSVKVFQME